MSEARKLYTTAHVADKLGVSPASVHSYMHQHREGTDSRFRRVPDATHVIENPQGRPTPLWTVAEVAGWSAWYRSYRDQRDPRGRKPTSEWSATDD